MGGRYDAKRILTVQSRKSIEIPLSDIMTAGAIQIYPEIEAQGLLFLQFRHGKVIVTAGKYVGLIPLTPTISIDVQPKMPVGNLAHVLDRARASLKSLENSSRLYDAGEAPGATVLEFLLRNLVDALEPVLSHGFLKTFVRNVEVTSVPRGRINLGESFQKCWSTGQKHRVSTHRFEHTTDNAPNRLIAFALTHMLEVLGRQDANRNLITGANELFSHFPRQIGHYQRSDYDTCKRLLQSQNLSSIRSYYYRPIEIALLILSEESIVLDKLGSAIELQTFIIDFELVFETYLRRVLEKYSPSGYTVKDGNSEGKKALYDDRDSPTAEPDIVIESELRTPLIAEVKYKDDPKRPDINQAIAYGLSYRTDRVVLLHQCRENGRRGLYDKGSINGLRVQAYAFDLAAEDIELEEARLVEVIFSMAEQTAPQALVA